MYAMRPFRTMPTDALGTCVVLITSATAAATCAERSGGSESIAWAWVVAGRTTLTSAATGIRRWKRMRGSEEDATWRYGQYRGRR